MQQAAKESTICTKEGCEEPRAGAKPWCKNHLAEYQREYVKTKEGMAEGKGFAQGVAAARAEWSEHFEHQRSGMFSGYEICDLIRQAPAPQRVD